MTTERSFVEIEHDEGYRDDLIFHINLAMRGKDMRAIRVRNCAERLFQEEPTTLKFDGIAVAVDPPRPELLRIGLEQTYEAIVDLTPDERSRVIRAVCVLMGIEPQNKESK